jgi:hypothetical protein
MLDSPGDFAHEPQLDDATWMGSSR